MIADGYEDNEFGSQTPGERALSDRSSIFTFTNAFEAATKDIFDNAGKVIHSCVAHELQIVHKRVNIFRYHFPTDALITIDGGPHTLWW